MKYTDTGKYNNRSSVQQVVCHFEIQTRLWPDWWAYSTSSCFISFLVYSSHVCFLFQCHFVCYLMLNLKPWRCFLCFFWANACFCQGFDLISDFCLEICVSISVLFPSQNLSTNRPWWTQRPFLSKPSHRDPKNGFGVPNRSVQLPARHSPLMPPHFLLAWRSTGTPDLWSASHFPFRSADWSTSRHLTAL